MSERLSFDVTLLEPEDGDDQWEAHFRGFSGYGDSADGAMAALGVEIQSLIEDAEYNRTHAPGVYGHGSNRPVSEVQRLDDSSIPSGPRSKDPHPVHSSELPKDRV